MREGEREREGAESERRWRELIWEGGKETDRQEAEKNLHH